MRLFINRDEHDGWVEYDGCIKKTFKGKSRGYPAIFHSFFRNWHFGKSFTPFNIYIKVQSPVVFGISKKICKI